MTKYSRSLLWTAIALMISIAYIGFSFKYRREIGWWSFIEPFALFMSVFTELMALFIGRMIPSAGKTLNIASIVFGVIFAIAIVGECIYFSFK